MGKRRKHILALIEQSCGALPYLRGALPVAVREARQPPKRIGDNALAACYTHSGRIVIWVKPEQTAEAELGCVAHELIHALAIWQGRPYEHPMIDAEMLAAEAALGVPIL